MQVFNEINARRLGDGYNIFERFFENGIFLGIIIVTVAVQILLTEIGGIFVGCNIDGLTPIQFLISIGFGLLAFPFKW